MLSRAVVRSLRASSFRQLPQVASRTSRRYASAAAETAKKTGDLPWLATAIVITIPSCYYILQPFATHDSGHGHEEHAEQSHGEKGEGEGKEEKADDEGKAEKSGEGNDEGGDDKSDSDSKGSPAKKEYKGPESRGTEIGKGVSSGSADDQGKKQEGLSNTDTKHSIDISQSPEQSKKGEGTAETAKVKGTIKPDRPTPEQTNKSDKDE